MSQPNTPIGFLPSRRPIPPIVLTGVLALQAVVVGIACVVSLPWDNIMPPELCHVDQSVPFHAAAVGLALIAIPIAASWLGYIRRLRRLLDYGIHILWVTSLLTIVLACLAGTGTLGDPSCWPVSSPV